MRNSVDLIPPCSNSTLWNHINGWEVVAAVLLIMGAWAATNIARMHFMVQMAKAARGCDDRHSIS